ncbi:esterase-like activity of phytase family protein [Microlunatus soli]|uniref:Uncharacterized conserved protein n=1 Tax=Microlunatus soli TaxID=630515 RepID=A0A1H1W2U3_9ACTN|nr:esterase-like activity of phytase family protein [Microlunatus soli]SDS91375.1 Uncharacterized conserved protein [Microlunatus soli]
MPRFRTALAALALATGLSGSGVAVASANPVDDPLAAGPTCAPSASAVSYSDALDKLVYNDQEIGGLSNLAWDARSRNFIATVDNHDGDPAKLWSLGDDLADPLPTRDPLVLKAADGTPYTGETADNEGLAVLPDGRYAVSSETEPSIRIFGRNGVQQQTLSVPERFAVGPDGEAEENATLEGLTVSRDGRTLVASMEGTLSGDTGDGNDRRILVYKATHGHHQTASYRLDRQVGYRVDDGMRISEIASYDKDKLLVLEAAYDPTVGNTIRLQAADLDDAPDVSSVSDLSAAPDELVDKKLVADVTNCPDLGATSKELQSNPLMDNYEAMAVTRGRHGAYNVSLLSDDNFNPTQTTRVLNLVAELP